MAFFYAWKSVIGFPSKLYVCVGIRFLLFALFLIQNVSYLKFKLYSFKHRQKIIILVIAFYFTCFIVCIFWCIKVVICHFIFNNYSQAFSKLYTLHWFSIFIFIWFLFEFRVVVARKQCVPSCKITQIMNKNLCLYFYLNLEPHHMLRCIFQTRTIPTIVNYV